MFRPLHIIVSLTTLALAANALAHGDVHLRINALTEEIKAKPTNALLYFLRAQLYRVDQDFTNALVDLKRATELDPGLHRLDFFHGLVLFEARRPREALPFLERYLAGEPPDPEAFKTRGRIHAALNQFEAAARDFDKAIEQSPMANPELFIEQADVFRAAGQYNEALRSLDAGIKRFGPLVTLQLPAIEVESALRRYDEALARVDKMMARLQRKESWWVRRAEILKKAGRINDARASYEEALAAINRLPPSHRNTRATLDLEKRIRSALEQDTASP